MDHSPHLLFSDWAAVLLSSPLQATVVLAVCALLVALVRRRSATLAHGVWSAGLLGVILIPCFTVMTQVWGISVWQVEVATLEAISATAFRSPGVNNLEAMPTTAPPIFETPTPKQLTGPAPLSVVQENVPTLQRLNAEPAADPHHAVITTSVWEAGLPVGRALIILWSAVATILVIRIAMAACSLLCAVRRGRTPSDSINKVADEVATELGLTRRWRVLVGSNRRMPVAFWCGRWTVVLPASADRWDRDMLRSVLLHEFGHIVRRDAVSDLIAQLAWCLHWFNPLVWYALSDTRRLREQACDDLVLSQPTMPRRAYARHLLEVVAECVVTRSPLVSAIAGSNQVETRIRRILNPTQVRLPSLLSRRIVTFVILTSVLFTSLFRLGVGQRTSADAAEPTKESLAEKTDGGLDVNSYLNVQGRILTPDGRPCSGADVVLRAVPGYFGIINSVPDILARTKSNAKGEYRFGQVLMTQPFRSRHKQIYGRAPFEVVATTKEHGLAWQTIEPGIANRVDVRLRDRARLHGTVLDPNGKPLAGALVQVTSIGDLDISPDGVARAPGHINLHPSEFAPKQMTSADGQFELSNLPVESRCGMKVQHPDYPDDYFYAAVGDRAEAGSIDIHGVSIDVEVSPVKRKLRRGYRVRLTLLDERGMPLSGQPRLSGGAREYSFTQLGPGRYGSAVRDIGSYTIRATDDVGFSFRQKIDLFDRHAENALNVQLKRPETRMIEGVVQIESSGQGVADVDVNWTENVERRHATSNANATTNSKGRFRMRVLPGEGRLYLAGKAKGVLIPSYPAVDPQESFKIFQTIDVPADGEPPEFKLAVSRGLVISGLITGPDGRPVANARVQAVGHDRFSGNEQTAVTNSEGRYEISGLNPRYRYTVRALGGDRAGEQAVAGIEGFPITTTRRATADIVLRAGVAVTGLVTFQDEPVADTPIELVRGMRVENGTRYRVTAATKTDKKGRYRLPGLQPGDYYQVNIKPDFDAIAPGWRHTSPYAVTIPVDQVGDYELDEMKLVELGQSIAGRVVDPDGNPVAGASISAFIAEGNVGLSRVDRYPVPWTEASADGRFKLTFLPKERIKLMAYIRTDGGKGGPIRFPAHVLTKMNQQDVEIILDPSLLEE